MRSLYDVPAPAKLNLFLHITVRRADGYHLLQSAFMLIDWCDTLHFERRAGGRTLIAQDLQIMPIAFCLAPSPFEHQALEVRVLIPLERQRRQVCVLARGQERTGLLRLLLINQTRKLPDSAALSEPP